ncbi:MAG TPA: DUF3563 family protein [Burkholderiaceae bacterium]
MSRFLDLLKTLSERSERRAQERAEAYLAQSTDLYDLERRMRELDRDEDRKPLWLSGSGYDDVGPTWH